MKKEKIARKKEPIIDGWGLIIVIIGLALLFLGDSPGSRNAGIIILIIGFIRVLYVLFKYGKSK